MHWTFLGNDQSHRFEAIIQGFAESARKTIRDHRVSDLGYRHPSWRGEAVTGKGPMTGNNVSHANNKTKRRFLPNLQYRRFWVETENRWVRLRVSSAALRLIDKNGIDAVLADLRARGQA